MEMPLHLHDMCPTRSAVCWDTKTTWRSCCCRFLLLCSAILFHQLWCWHPTSMGCIPSKEKFASGTSTTIDSAPTDKTTATVTTEAIPDKIATKPPRKTSKKARLSTVERENPGPEIPIPQWPSLAERSLDNCLPVANDYVPVRGLRDRQSPPVGWSVFKNSRDRWKFISMYLTLPHTDSLDAPLLT